MPKDKSLDDYTDEEITRLFIEDCLVPPISSKLIPDFAINDLMVAYCAQVGLSTPSKTKLTHMLRKYYVQTTKDGITCYRAAIRPGLL